CGLVAGVGAGCANRTGEPAKAAHVKVKAVNFKRFFIASRKLPQIPRVCIKKFAEARQGRKAVDHRKNPRLYPCFSAFFFNCRELLACTLALLLACFWLNINPARVSF